MITAVSASSGRRSSLLSSVVLPLPKKPVSTVTGMRCSAAFCVSLMKSQLLISSPRVARIISARLGVTAVPSPKAPSLPEILPGLLEPVATALAAGRRLLGEGLERPGHVLGGTGRGREIGQHMGRHRAIVQGAERALQAHRRLDIGPGPSGRKGRPQEGRGIAQLLDG